MTDRRSEKAKEYRRLYKTPRWQALRMECLREALFKCTMCGAVKATVADHVEPHKGDEAKFFDRNNLQALCKPCHDGAKQSEERRGYSAKVGIDGWPVDPRHPANGGGGSDLSEP